MNFDGAGRNAKLMGHDLVGHAHHKLVGNVALAWGQDRDFCSRRFDFRRLVAGFCMRVQGVTNRGDDLLALERLFYEMDGASVHGPNHHRDIGVTADHQHNQIMVLFGQFHLELQPIEPGYEIDDQASFLRMVIGKKIGCGGKCFDLEIRYRQRHLKPSPDIRIAIDNKDILPVGHFALLSIGPSTLRAGMLHTRYRNE